MPDPNDLPSTPHGGTGGGVEGREPVHPNVMRATDERGEDGLTPRKRERLARKIARANMGLVSAGAKATKGLGKAVVLLNESLESDTPPKGAELVRTTDCLHRLVKDAAKADTPDPSKDGLHLHLHGDLDKIDSMVIDHFTGREKTPRVNGNGEED